LFVCLFVCLFVRVWGQFWGVVVEGLLLSGICSPLIIANRAQLPKAPHGLQRSTKHDREASNRPQPNPCDPHLFGVHLLRRLPALLLHAPPLVCGGEAHHLWGHVVLGGGVSGGFVLMREPVFGGSWLCLLLWTGQASGCFWMGSFAAPPPPPAPPPNPPHPACPRGSLAAPPPRLWPGQSPQASCSRPS
jgi:hypothetical protein